MQQSLDSFRLLQAINFACDRHRNQRRDDPDRTPYINHAVGVATILSKEGGVRDYETLAAAVLHDTVEDTETSIEEIREAFGEKVAHTVAQCTDDTTLPRQERKRLQIETMPGKTREAKLVKMADKLYNLRDIQRAVPEGWTKERVEEYFAWSKKVLDGARGTNPGLEDAIDRVMQGVFVFEGKTYPCLAE